MSYPAFKGGQGRSQADIRKAASGMVWTWLLIGAAVLALWGASR